MYGSYSIISTIVNFILVVLYYKNFEISHTLYVLSSGGILPNDEKKEMRGAHGAKNWNIPFGK